MSEGDMDRPYVEVTIQTRMAVPDDVPEDEALEAAKAQFNEPPDDQDSTIDFRYVEPGSDRSTEGSADE